jgi:hypothetical protein
MLGSRVLFVPYLTVSCKVPLAMWGEEHGKAITSTTADPGFTSSTIPGSPYHRWGLPLVPPRLIIYANRVGLEPNLPLTKLQRSTYASALGTNASPKRYASTVYTYGSTFLSPVCSETRAVVSPND